MISQTLMSFNGSGNTAFDKNMTYVNGRNIRSAATRVVKEQRRKSLLARRTVPTVLTMSDIDRKKEVARRNEVIRAASAWGVEKTHRQSPMLLSEAFI
jgi:hypothetical protein